MKTNLFIAAVISITIFACKKTDSINYSTAIIGKWRFVNSVHWNTPNPTGATKKDTINYVTGSYADIRTNGYIYEYVKTLTGSSHYDSVSYFVSEDNLYTTNSAGFKDTFAILLVNSNNLSFYQKKIKTISKDEYWLNLEK